MPRVRLSLRRGASADFCLYFSENWAERGPSAVLLVKTKGLGHNIHSWLAA